MDLSAPSIASFDRALGFLRSQYKPAVAVIPPLTISFFEQDHFPLLLTVT